MSALLFPPEYKIHDDRDVVLVLLYLQYSEYVGTQWLQIHPLIQQTLVEHLLKKVLCQVIFGVKGIETSTSERTFQLQETEPS